MDDFANSMLPVKMFFTQNQSMNNDSWWVSYENVFTSNGRLFLPHEFNDILEYYFT